MLSDTTAAVCMFIQQPGKAHSLLFRCGLESLFLLTGCMVEHTAHSDQPELGGQHLRYDILA